MSCLSVLLALLLWLEIALQTKSTASFMIETVAGRWGRPAKQLQESQVATADVVVA